MLRKSLNIKCLFEGAETKLEIEKKAEELAGQIIADDAIGHNEKYEVRLERTLLASVILYVYYEMPSEKQNLCTVGLLLEEETTSRNEDNNFKSDFDIRINRIEKKYPEHSAVTFYNLYVKGRTKDFPTDISTLMQVREYIENLC